MEKKYVKNLITIIVAMVITSVLFVSTSYGWFVYTNKATTDGGFVGGIVSGATGTGATIDITGKNSEARQFDLYPGETMYFTIDISGMDASSTYDIKFGENFVTTNPPTDVYTDSLTLTEYSIQIDENNSMPYTYFNEKLKGILNKEGSITYSDLVDESYTFFKNFVDSNKLSDSLSYATALVESDLASAEFHKLGNAVPMSTVIQSIQCDEGSDSQTFYMALRFDDDYHPEWSYTNKDDVTITYVMNSQNCFYGQTISIVLVAPKHGEA